MVRDRLPASGAPCRGYDWTGSQSAIDYPKLERFLSVVAGYPQLRIP